MPKVKWKIESSEQQAEVIQFLEDRIYEFNSSVAGQFEGVVFAKIIRDENNNIIAGISGWTWAMASEIMLLWVEERYRKIGLGEALLKSAEDDIIKKGCRTILVRSYNFQAPAFYEKNGYKTMFILEDFPVGYNCYNLVKSIR